MTNSLVVSTKLISQMNKYVKQSILEDISEIMSTVGSGTYLEVTYDYMLQRMLKKFKFTLEEFEVGFKSILDNHIAELGLTTYDATEICLYTENKDIMRYSVHFGKKVNEFTEFKIFANFESTIEELEDLKLSYEPCDFNFLYPEHIYNVLMIEN